MLFFNVEYSFMDDVLTSHHVCLLKWVFPFIRYKQKRLLGLQKESNQGELCSQNILPSFAVSYNCHLLVNGRCLHFEALVVDGS